MSTPTTPAPTQAPGTALPAQPWAGVVNRRYHFSPAGAAYVVTTMVMIVGAINGQNNLLFWMFGLGVAGLLVSGVLSGSPLMGLQIRRDVPDVGTVGQPLRVRYTLHSRNWVIPAFALTIEELARARGWLSKEVSATWAGHMPKVVIDAPFLRPRGGAVAEVVVQPYKRGEVTFAPVRASTAFPFGIIRKSVTFSAPLRVLVRPQPADVPPELFRPRSSAGATVGVLTPARAGLEFYSLREYQPGDALRSVAARASARMDRPIVRTFATPPGERLWVQLDCAGVGDEDVERVVSVAAGVATRSVASGLEVGLLGPDGKVLEPQRSGRRQVDLLLDRLALFNPAHPSPGGEPSLQFSRVVVVHALPKPSVNVPAHAICLSAHDPRVTLPAPAQASVAAPAPHASGRWRWLFAFLGDDDARTPSPAGGAP